MSDPRTELIRRIHQSPTELVLAITGGGSPVIGDLLSVPGGTRTLLEATVPYTHAAIDRYMGCTPEHYCCERSARQLAVAAFQRGQELIEARHSGTDGDEAKGHPATENGDADLIGKMSLIGLGCTASLSTDREKKGDYRVCVATQTLRRTTVCALPLVKGKRTRQEEERLVADLILNMIENARMLPEPDLVLRRSGNTAQPETAVGGAEEEAKIYAFSAETDDCQEIEEYLPLRLDPREKIVARRAVATPPLIDLFYGRTAMLLWRSGEIAFMKTREESKEQLNEAFRVRTFNPYAEYSNAVFPGSFNPVHEAHLGMIASARDWLSSIVSLEISVQNALKPPMDYIGLRDRLTRIEAAVPDQPIWLTRSPFFLEKAMLFPGTTFVVGADTLRRFADVSRYDNHPHHLHDVLREIAALNCRFLVFARKHHDGIESLETMTIPDMLRSLCDEVPPGDFTIEMSSTDLRRRESWLPVREVPPERLKHGAPR